VYDERDAERQGVLHDIDDEGGQLVDLAFLRLEEELVVNLQDEA
jgi:hypothetical protein